MKEFKTPKLTIEEKDQLLLADGDEEVIFGKLFTAYQGLIVHIASRLKDPTGSIDLDERKHAGTIGLLMTKRNYKNREVPRPDLAVSYNVLKEIERAITFGRRRIPDEEIGISSLDELSGQKESEDSRPFLEVIKVDGGLRHLEEDVCSQVSFKQLFEAVDCSYRSHHRRCLKEAQMEAKRLREEVEKNTDNDGRSTIPLARAERKLKRLKDKENKIGRNLDVFLQIVCGDTYEEIGGTYGLKRGSAHHIFKEITEVVLSNPDTLAHLSEITGLPVNEIIEKVAKNNH